MNERIYARADQMLDKFIEIDKHYKWEHNLTKHFAALYYEQNKLQVPLDRIDEAIEQIKSETGVFSNYRGPSKFILATLLSVEKDSVSQVFQEILKVESLLREVGFKNNAYLPMSSFVLYRMVEAFERRSVAERAMAIYKEMKKAHPFLTDGADAPLSILMAAKGGNVDRAELFYKKLSDSHYNKGNELQLLTHILALSAEEDSLIIQRCESLFEVIKHNKLKASMGMYPAVGLLALIGTDHVEALVELTRYMMKLKKYKWLGKGTNLLMASSLVVSEWLDSHQDELMASVVGITLESIVIAQTIALIAAASAASVAASSSS